MQLDVGFKMRHIAALVSCLGFALVACQKPVGPAPSTVPDLARQQHLSEISYRILYFNEVAGEAAYDLKVASDLVGKANKREFPIPEGLEAQLVYERAEVIMFEQRMSRACWFLNRLGTTEKIRDMLSSFDRIAATTPELNELTGDFRKIGIDAIQSVGCKSFAKLVTSGVSEEYIRYARFSEWWEVKHKIAIDLIGEIDLLRNRLAALRDRAMQIKAKTAQQS